MKNDFFEFKDFIDTPPTQVPSHISQFINSKVARDLNPPYRYVSLKAGIIHIFASLLTLTFCPQLGVGPFGGGEGITHVFMELGPSLCALFCGATLLGTGSLLTVILLTQSELRIFSKYKLFSIPIASGSAYALLMLAGGDSTDSLWWLIGACAAAWLILKAATSLKLSLVR